MNEAVAALIVALCLFGAFVSYLWYKSMDRLKKAQGCGHHYSNYRICNDCGHKQVMVKK